MSERNRLNTARNSDQGKYKKVLCVCSTGCLRSPTAAVVLSQEPYNYNTISCGMDTKYAVIPLDDMLLEWADEIVCMESHHKNMVMYRTQKPVIVLDIADDYEYRQPELIELIKKNYPKEKKND